MDGSWRISCTSESKEGWAAGSGAFSGVWLTGGRIAAGCDATHLGREAVTTWRECLNKTGAARRCRAMLFVPHGRRSLARARNQRTYRSKQIWAMKIVELLHRPDPPANYRRISNLAKIGPST